MIIVTVVILPTGSSFAARDYNFIPGSRPAAVPRPPGRGPQLA